MAYYNNQGYGGSNPNVVFTQPGQPIQNVPLPPGMRNSLFHLDKH